MHGPGNRLVAPPPHPCHGIEVTLLITVPKLMSSPLLDLLLVPLTDLDTP